MKHLFAVYGDSSSAWPAPRLTNPFSSTADAVLRAIQDLLGR